MGILTAPMHLASTSPPRGQSLPCQGSLLCVEYPRQDPPLIDEVVGGRRPCGVGMYLVTGVPGGWVHYDFSCLPVGGTGQSPGRCTGWRSHGMPAREGQDLDGVDRLILYFLFPMFGM